MKTLDKPTPLLITTLLAALFLLTNIASAAMLTAEHKVLKARDRIIAGTTQLELAITLTNHGETDIEHVHFHFDNARKLSLFSRVSPLLVDRIPAGSRITINWKIEGKGDAKHWQKGRSFSLTGQGVIEDQYIVPLKVLSESIVSLD